MHHDNTEVDRRWDGRCNITRTTLTSPNLTNFHLFAALDHQVLGSNGTTRQSQKWTHPSIHLQTLGHLQVVQALVTSGWNWWLYLWLRMCKWFLKIQKHIIPVEVFAKFLELGVKIFSVIRVSEISPTDPQKHIFIHEVSKEKLENFGS